jgi:hypothetical protein
MNLPFTADQFISVFTRYNEAIGPLPILAYALAALSLFLVFRRPAAASRVVPLVLAGMWAFTGIAYHLVSFSAINPAARLFGALFVLQAIFFAVEAFRGRVAYTFSIRKMRSRMGVIMVLFSSVIYPIIGAASGHGYPNGPVFGLTPCPLVIFTFGTLLLTDRTLPKYLVAIPLMWALVGSTAARALGIHEDTGLLVTGLLATTMLLTRRSVPRDPAQPSERGTGRLSAVHALVHRAAAQLR